MSIEIELEHRVQTCSVSPTERAMQIAVMFGLPLDQQQALTILPPIRVPLEPGSIVFVTGVSGGGKSTLLRLLDEQLASLTPSDCAGDRPAVVCSTRLPDLQDQPLVDAMALPEGDAAMSPACLEEVCRWLSLAGLNDAAVMLRRPSELSEGQRHRLRLAQAIAVAERRPESWSVLLIDEFGSTLDRTTAHAIARGARRRMTGANLCLVAATAHDDLLEPLKPDVLVEVGPGGVCGVHACPH